MPPAPKHTRRWFQFSLGTVFVVVTVLAVWLGWELKLVRERQAMRTWITANQGMVLSGEDSQKSFDPPPRAAQISAVSRWLGDEAVAYIWMPESATDADWGQARPLFPEALWMDELSYDWVKSDQAGQKTKADDTSGRFLTIVTAAEEQKAYNAAAKRAGVTVSEWARDNLNKAAQGQP